jgi:hypothetical protein
MWVLLLFGGVISSEVTIRTDEVPAKTIGLLCLGAGIEQLATGNGQRPEVDVSSVWAYPNWIETAKVFGAATFGYAKGEAEYGYVLSTRKYTILRYTHVTGKRIYTRTTIFGVPDTCAVIFHITYEPGFYHLRIEAHTKYCQLLTRLFGQRQLNASLTTVVSKLSSLHDDSESLVVVLVSAAKQIHFDFMQRIR